MSIKAQETEETPLDTLTRSVSLLQQNFEAKSRLLISGYIQGQYQVAEASGEASFEGGTFPSGVYQRFMIRRGRVKLNYTGPFNDKGFSLNNYMLQMDFTEKGVRLMDAYARFTDPWLGAFSLTVGLQNRPFGYEVPYSSSFRESPERGRMSQLLFPNERDLGAMLTIQGAKISNWHWIKFDIGLFNGKSTPNVNTDASESDNKKDIITHLSIARSNKVETIKYGFGLSYYNGGFRIDSVDVYSMNTDPTTLLPSFHQDSKKIDNYHGGVVGARGNTKREYFGADFQLTYGGSAGITVFRAEYIQGQQPGITTTDQPWFDTRSQIVSTLSTKDIYNRNFNGAYLYLIQNILQSPFQLVVKYDWYDPNTDVKGSQIGATITTANYKTTSASDLRYDTWGFGTIIHMDAGIKLMIYYDIPKNENSTLLQNYKSDVKDNVLTLRLQSTF